MFLRVLFCCLQLLYPTILSTRETSGSIENITDGILLWNIVNDDGDEEDWKKSDPDDGFGYICEQDTFFAYME